MSQELVHHLDNDDKVTSEEESTTFIGEAPRLNRRLCGGSHARWVGLAIAIASCVALAMTWFHRDGGSQIAAAEVGAATGLVELDSRRRMDERATAIVQVLNKKPERELKGIVKKALGAAAAVANLPKTKTEAQELADAKAKEEAMKKQRKNNCAFNIIYATQYLARAGLMIQAAARTCPQSTGLLQKICAINSLVTVAMFGDLALEISNAISTCAPHTDVHSLCASAGEALVVSLSVVGAGSIVSAAGCQPGLKPADLGLPAGATPADLKGPPYTRRLFLGGGQANFAAQCVLDWTQVAWALASVGIAITAAVRDGCPVRGTGILKQLTMATCSMDIGAVLYAFGRISLVISLAMIHCTNDLNLVALCSAGVSALVAAAAALVVTGDAFFIACDAGIKTIESGGIVPAEIGAAAEAGATRRLKALAQAGASADTQRLRALVEDFGYNVSDPVRLPNFDNLDSAFKLLEAYDGNKAERMLDTRSVRETYKTPEEAWRQMGFDPEVIPADPKPAHQSERFVKLMEPVLSDDDMKQVDAAMKQPPPQWE